MLSDMPWDEIREGFYKNIQVFAILALLIGIVLLFVCIPDRWCYGEEQLPLSLEEANEREFQRPRKPQQPTRISFKDV